MERTWLIKKYVMVIWSKNKNSKFVNKMPYETGTL